MNSRLSQGVHNAAAASKTTRRPLLAAFLTTCLLITACAWRPPLEIRKDGAAEQMVAALRQTNAGLVRFKCVGKVTLADPDKPVQSHRAAFAGEIPDRLRIDMLAPFGGSSGTLASDGNHLFLVMPRSGEYYSKRFGNGSLNRLIQLDISVGDLLELMVGRVPIEEGFSGRLLPGEDNAAQRLELVDRWGRVRQRITLEDALQPTDSAWFDGNGSATHRVRFDSRQTVDGFVIPRLLEIVGAAGSAARVTLERCEVNPDLDERLFTPARPSD